MNAEPQEQWLDRMRDRLRRELDELYLVAEERAAPEGAAAVADERLQRRIALVLRAFDLMASGEYGGCAVCGTRIAPARLEADPTRDTCAACAAPDG